MAENEVSILVKVIAEGQESLKQVSNDLGNLTKTEQTNTAVTKGANESLTLWNASLTKLVPELKGIAPILSFMNIGFLAGGAAVAGLAVESMKAAQTLQSLLVDIVNAGVAASQSGAKGMDDAAASTAEVNKVASSTGATLDDIAKAFAMILPVTRDVSIAESLINQAWEAHVLTGKPFLGILKELIDAYAGNSVVIDSNTGKQLLNKDASDKVADSYKKQGGLIRELQTTYDDLFHKRLEPLKIALGVLGTILLDVGKAFVIVAGDIVLGIGWLFNNFVSLGVKLGVWVASVRDKLIDGFREAINWIAERINWLIAQLNRVKIPGTNIGVNLPMIPTLDTGGIVTQPTIAALAQNGKPEAVIPLSGMGGGLNISLYMPDGSLVGQWYSAHLEDNLRLRGAF